MVPTDKQIQNGTFKLIEGIWHKRCTGPAHEEPVFLPATEKYFHARQSGHREGELVSRCRLCINWSKLKSPGSHHGYIPADQARPFVEEAVNRVGIMRLSELADIAPGTIENILYHRSSYVRKMTMRRLMLELVSLRRQNVTMTDALMRYKRDKRHHRMAGGSCAGCGTSLDDYTEGCPSCWERKRGRKRRSK